MRELSLLEIIQNELDADRVWDDVTTSLLEETGKKPLRAEIISRESGIFCGAAILSSFQRILCPMRFHAAIADGVAIQPGQVVASVEADAQSCLRVERTLLNFLALTCAVATETRRYVEKVKPYGVKILATRKTLPGLREVQLMAVRAGGGLVHRRSLSDGVLIKENHSSLVDEKTLLERAQTFRSPLQKTEIEVQSMDQLKRVLATEGLIDIIMLDNFSVDEAREAILRIEGRCAIEISGGINLDTVESYAALKPDFISTGRLTHTIKALDISLELRAL